VASGERGLTLIEVVIASAIITLMALIGIAACKALAGVTATLYTAGHDSAAIDAQAARFRDDAATAFAVFVPASDINGAPNPSPEGAHEVDYYAKTDSGAEYLWCYFYDAARHTLQRFDYDSHGTRGVRDGRTGAIDAAASYPPMFAVRAFSAQTVSADELGDPAHNPYGGFAALLAHPALPRSVSYDHPGLDIPAAAGGNAIVQVSLANATTARVVHLMPGSLPSGFTVIGLPRWHAIVFRVDQTHRFWFGPAGKSHVFINARVEVSYDNWKTHPRWCEFNLLGNPYGLDGHDPNANPQPKAPFEQAESLLNRCRARNPTPPPPGSSGNAPEPDVVTPQTPGPTPTPPPCWTDPRPPQGRCWPPDAPVDWPPPAPLPADPPPPWWCQTHAQSPACRVPLPSPSAGGR